MEQFCSRQDQKSNTLMKTAWDEGLLPPSELWSKAASEYVRSTDVGMKPPEGTSVPLFCRALFIPYSLVSALCASEMVPFQLCT